MLFSKNGNSNPNYSNPTISISDPCTCLNNSTSLVNGQFSETIQVNSQTGETWFVLGSTGLYDINSPAPPNFPSILVPGTVLSESPGGSGIYIFEGIHVDAQGYSVIVENNLGQQLSIANTCYYPNIEILNLENQFCLYSTPVVLEGDADGASGNSSFTINGISATTFDPLDLGLGNHIVSFSFDAGVAVPNDPSDPGCTSIVSKVVNVVQTPSQIACNADLNVTLDGNCEAFISPDLVLEGSYDCFDDYLVVISFQNDSVPNPVSGSYIGDQLIAKVVHLPSNNSCWGYLKVEDKTPPMIDCKDITIQCYQNPANIPAPAADDNCDSNPKENLILENIDDSDPCQGVTITRTWLAFDDYDNISDTCVQTISIDPPQLPTFPPDRIWTCPEYTDFPTIVDATAYTGILENTGSGIPTNISGQYCMYDVDFSDQIIQTCGTTFKIIRTWTIFDWCSNQLVLTGASGEDNIQVIEIADQTAPVISHIPFSVSTNVVGSHPEPCRSTGLLSPATVSDECNAYTVRIFTPMGEAIYVNGVNGLQGGYIPSPGLEQGSHIITYQAEDACGNISEFGLEVIVVDDVAPSAICDELTSVSINSIGEAEIFAEVFDDGSFDDCCVDRFEVRRMEDNCGIPGNTEFGESIIFCCEDALSNPHDVAFQIWDCAGNYNICMIQVNVEETQIPYVVYCPTNRAITCDYYSENIETPLNLGQTQVLEQFGYPEFADNCEYTIDEDLFLDIDECGNGKISRSFSATDINGNLSSTCLQIIFVNHVSDWVIEFPEDKTANCDQGDEPEFGEPQIFNESCELLALSFEDEVYTVVQDACYKIVRNWTAINWCVLGQEVDQETVEVPESQLGVGFPACDLDGDGDCDDRTFADSRTASGIFDTDPDNDQYDGFITYQQVIKVIDNTAPNMTCPDEFTVCIEDNDCFATVIIPQPDLIDCSFDVNITALSALGNGFGPFNDVVPGNYLVLFNATDNCGNSSACEIEFKVEDCKKPSPYCKSGLITDLMIGTTNLGMIEVNASQLDDGSFDNCSGELIFSFSAFVIDTSRVFGCAEIGQEIVDIWVTDASGNQDFCQTTITIQDNNEYCTDDPLISGLIATEMDEAIENVIVKLSGDILPDQTTGADGMYELTGLELGGDYTVVPSKNINPLNGVSTFDMVLITKHILSTQMLNSPYKILAADVNNTGSVTTMDLVHLRKLILHIDSDFQNNTSWRFIPKDYVFQDSEKPWDAMEVITINNLDGDLPFTDFVGIKTGDVNNSANPNELLGSDDRNFNEKIFFEIENREIRVGEEFVVDFKLSNFEQIQGYQFTLDFDQNALEFKDIIETQFVGKENFGLKLLKNGKITTSWNSFSNQEATSKGLTNIFSLKFKSLVNKDLNELFQISSEYTKAEAYNQENDILNLGLKISESGLVFAYDETVLFLKNHPNPFAQSTIISFSLREAGRTSIRLVDITGKTLKVITQHLETGYHEFEIYRADLGSPGVYFYSIETEKITLTNKLILSSQF